MGGELSSSLFKLRGLLESALHVRVGSHGVYVGVPSPHRTVSLALVLLKKPAQFLAQIAGPYRKPHPVSQAKRLWLMDQCG